MKLKFTLAPAVAGLAIAINLNAGPFAAAVVNYNPGNGFSAGYTNTNAVLGAPSPMDSYGDPVDPFDGPYETDQILSLGAGGSLTVKFNQPLVPAPGNPFGRDFVIFGNSFFIVTNYGNSTEMTGGAVYHDNCHATVSVSPDGVTFYELNPALAPQLNALYPTDASGNFQLPVNPAITNFAGLTLDQIRGLYSGSAGGASYSISWAQDSQGEPVSLFDARYVRIDVQSGQALVAGFASVTSSNRVFAEDFSGDPAFDGWKYFGDTNLFTWDSTNRNLEVTWDSSQPNSYFYHPLGTALGRSNDFSMSFDLLLRDYAIGVNPSLPDTFELAAGFQNFTQSTGPNFFRGGYPSQADIVEFDFFQWDHDFSTNSINPTLVDSNNVFFFPGSSVNGIVELPTNVVMRVSLTYNASSQTGMLSVTTNQTPLVAPVVFDLNQPSLFGTFTDFDVDTFSIESYSDANAYGSLLAHGTVGNVLVVVWPVSLLQGSLHNGVGQVQFNSLTNWNYTLESSADLQTWRSAAPSQSGNGGTLTLLETNAPQQVRFYRVNAQPAH